MNAYLIETRSGIIVIDALRTVKEAQALRAMIAAIGKPVLGVVLTHAHPDHYGGLPVLMDGLNAPVFATQAVAADYPRNFAQSSPILAAHIGSQWPGRVVAITRPLKDGESVQLDQVRLTAHHAGPGESAADSWWDVEGAGLHAAFVGDLVINRIPSPGQSGELTRWLANLHRLRNVWLSYPVLYPGHGEAGGIGIVDWEIGYLTLLHDVVSDVAHGASKLTDGQKAEVQRRMMAYMPDDKGESYVLLDIDNYAAELAREGR